MTPVKLSFSSLDPVKWNALVNSQQGKVPFYDWASLESGIQPEDKSEFVAVVLQNAEKYQLALPGTERNGIFSNYFFRTFDNLDLLTGSDVSPEELSAFVKFIFDSYDGIILRNFNSGSVLFGYERKFFQGPSRKCPYLDLPVDPENIFPVINKSFKKTLRWNLNGLPKYGITAEIISGRKVQQVFEKEFMPAHENRMREKKIKSGFMDVAVQYFFNALNVHPYSGALLTVARHNGTFVGGIYGVYNNRTYAYVASGIRADIEKYSVGQFLIYKTMEFLVQQNCNRFDFLRGMESYKSLWTKNREENETRYYYKPGSMIAVFRHFLNDNKRRYGRMKCFKILLQSWFRPARKIQ